MRPDTYRFVWPDAERFNDRWRHPDHKLWDHQAAYRQRATAMVARGKGGSPSLSPELARLQAQQDAIRGYVKAWKDELAQKRARERLESERLKRKSDAAWEKFVGAFNWHWAACRKAGFNPNQPRAPAGNPGGGQWTSGGEDTASSGENREDDSSPSSESSGQVVRTAGRGGIPRTLWRLTVRQFVSTYCRGSINRELPRQFDDISISELFEIAKGGDSAARTCAKLLKEQRFRK